MKNFLIIIAGFFMTQVALGSIYVGGVEPGWHDYTNKKAEFVIKIGGRDLEMVLTPALKKKLSKDESQVVKIDGQITADGARDVIKIKDVVEVLKRRNSFSCYLNDTEYKMEFTVDANMYVTKKLDEGYLSYGSAFISSDSIAESGKSYWVDRGSIQKNVKYNGTKYKNHFKFEMDFAQASSYGASFPSASLIIAKDLDNSDQLEVEAIVLNANYDDHHGDYIPLNCKINKGKE